MVTAILRPNIDVIADWGWPTAGDHYINVDEAVTQPSTPSNDYIMGEEFIYSNNNEYDQFGFPGISGIATATDLTFWFHGQIDNDGGAGNYPEFSWYNGTSWSSDIECSSFPSDDEFGNATSGAWQSVVVNGLNLSETDINALEVRFRADLPDGDKETLSFNIVYCVYCIVTYRVYKPVKYAVEGSGKQLVGEFY